MNTKFCRFFLTCVKPEILTLACFCLFSFLFSIPLNTNMKFLFSVFVPLILKKRDVFTI